MNSDLSDFEALIARLAAIDFSQSEQATREIAVNSVIAALGWDTLNPDEVGREYSVRGGRVDYCLRASERNLVLIEVKRAGSDLDEHQEQLLRYAFDEFVPLAALTDGLVWWLYLPRAEAAWEQRRFFRIDLKEHDAAHVASAINRFLNRDDLVSGAALEEAKREFESQERDRRVRAALREAWRRVLSDPQNLLRELLAESVKEISGHDPEPETLSEFLLGIVGRGSTEVESLPPQQRSGRIKPAGDGDSSAVELTEESSENGQIFVTTAFARRVLTRRQVPGAMKKVLKALYEAHPRWLPVSTLQDVTGYVSKQFGGLMGAFGKRMSGTEDYDPEAQFFEYRWNEDECVWDYRLPDTVREALTLEQLF